MNQLLVLKMVEATLGCESLHLEVQMAIQSFPIRQTYKLKLWKELRCVVTGSPFV